MANTFVEFESVDIPASATDLYTAPGATKSLLLSVIFANKTSGSVNVTVEIVRTGGTPVSMVVKDAPIPVGGALDVIVNKPLVLSAGDKIRATASAVTSIDATGSVLEIT